MSRTQVCVTHVCLQILPIQFTFSYFLAIFFYHNYIHVWYAFCICSSTVWPKFTANNFEWLSTSYASQRFCFKYNSTISLYNYCFIILEYFICSFVWFHVCRHTSGVQIYGPSWSSLFPLPCSFQQFHRFDQAYITLL